MPTPSPLPTWFEYPIQVHPQHTDYGGVVWHGTYIAWLESARVECLRAAGASFEQLITTGYDLPVVKMDIRYRRPLTLGTSAVVKTRLAPVTGIRLNWLYEIETVGPTTQICLTGQVTVVAVNVRDRKIARQLPAELKSMLAQVTRYFELRPDSFARNR